MELVKGFVSALLNLTTKKKDRKEKQYKYGKNW
jgi:hypothetical protein